MGVFKGYGTFNTPLNKPRTYILFIHVEHTYTAYFHSFGKLQLMKLSPFIGFGIFDSLPPHLPKHVILT